MPFETLTAAPAADAFTPLQEHQEQTPGTFFDAKPVLHLHCPDTKLLVSKQDLEGQSVFPDLRVDAPTNGNAVNGNAEDDAEDEQLVIPGINVWVTSQKLIVYSPAKAAGVAIPYQSITLHATQRLTVPGTAAETQGLYMQLGLNDSPHVADDSFETLEITLVPDAVANPPTTAADATPINALFAAVTACADLNPDPAQQGDSDDDEGLGEGGAVPAFPGAGGWITADNVDEFVEGGDGLPVRAGMVHPRDEDFEDADEGDEAAAADGPSEETKWRRTEE